jgi:TolB-like protein
MPTAGEKAYCFEGFTLDLKRGCVRTVDRELELRPKSFEVLRYLVENSGRLIPKDELIRAVWRSVVATDDSLVRCVSDIRLALDDAEQQIIRTVSRRGYLFASPVSELATAEVVAPKNLGVQPAPRSRTALPPFDKPSIAVLPFQNMSDDAEQEYFADGLVEEIITSLSRTHWLVVIARNSTFRYKDRAIDVRRVGRELGVHYVLEGSVRKMSNRVRIAGQLIDAKTRAHLWADRFDGRLDDIFDLQDQFTASVIAAIAPKLQKAEIERAKRKSTENLDAYDCYLRGRACQLDTSRRANAEALAFFYRAIELDPELASAYGFAASCYAWRKVNGWLTDPACELAAAERLARRAAALGEG